MNRNPNRWLIAFVIVLSSLIVGGTANAQSEFVLTVRVEGRGATGTVSSSPAGIDKCGGQCSVSFTASSSVTLTATPATGSSFAGWGGACSGTGACVVTMNAEQLVTASFIPETGSLLLTLSGLPTGSSVTLALNGGNNGFSARTLLTGTSQNLSDVTVGVYTVTAPNVTVGNVVYAPNAASQSATVTAGGNATINVVYSVFGPQTFALTVVKFGTGTGNVSSTPAGISCGATCSAYFTSGTSVTLTAAPNAGSSFVAWNGAACGSALNCTVTMDAATSVSATFDTTPPPTVNFALTVSKSGSGAGTVSSQPAGIDCGATCTANFASGSSVTLTAAPLSGSSFTSWSGACSGSGACVVTMSAAQGVTATFTLNAPTPPAPPAAPPASLSKPVTSPASLNANKGSSNVGALTLELGVGASSTVTLQALSLSASGTGNDLLDIAGVKIYVDSNGNGVVDAGETALTQGTFDGNDGAAALTLAAPRVFAANSTTKLLVTLDFNSSLAQTSFKLALGSLALVLLLGWRSKKRLAVVGLLALTVTINACRTEPVIPPTGSSTYAVSLTGISLKDSSGANISVSGLPIAGTTITVAK